MAMVDTNGFIGEVSFQNFLLFIFVVIITIILGNIARLIIARVLRAKVRPMIYKTLSRIAMYVIYFGGFYFAFKTILNFSISAFLAALGILGITLLLTMLPFLQNIFAGVVLSLERPFWENDIVEVNSNVCIVKDIMLRKTILRSLDGKLIIVPNIIFINGEVRNYSRGEFIRVDLAIEIRNDLNYPKAIDIINKELHEDQNILPHVPKKELNVIEKFFAMPKNIKVLEPKIFINSIDKDKISLQIWFWIWDILRKESIVSNFYEALLHEFKENRINLG